MSVARDQPIQINAEQLELLAEGDTKHLVFSDSVEVIQGEMRLFAGHLEAFYPEGASAATGVHYGVTIPGPDYGDLVKPFGGHGERVTDPARLQPALQEAMAAVNAGRTAILDVVLSK